MVTAGNNVKLYFHKLHKSRKKGKLPPSATVRIVILHMKRRVLLKPLISIKTFKEIATESTKINQHKHNSVKGTFHRISLYLLPK